MSTVDQVMDAVFGLDAEHGSRGIEDAIRSAVELLLEAGAPVEVVATALSKIDMALEDEYREF